MKRKLKSYTQSNDINQSIQDQNNTKGGAKKDRQSQLAGKEDCSSGICSVLWKPEAVNR